MRMPQSLKMLALACVMLLLPTLGSCATLTSLFETTDEVDVNAVACRAFRPITWSPRDTDATLAQVREHNAAWRALCAPAAP